METVTALGSVIKQWRKAASLTQAECAEALGVTQQTVSDWERDLSRPELSRSDAFDEVFGLPQGTARERIAGLQPTINPEGDSLRAVLQDFDSLKARVMNLLDRGDGRPDGGDR